MIVVFCLINDSKDQSVIYIICVFFPSICFNLSTSGFSSYAECRRLISYSCSYFLCLRSLFTYFFPLYLLSTSFSTPVLSLCVDLFRLFLAVHAFCCFLHDCFLSFSFLFCCLTLFVMFLCASFFSLCPGPSSDGSDGWGTSDGSSANDVQPACSQTHQPLRPHARSPGQLSGICAFVRTKQHLFN